MGRRKSFIDKKAATKYSLLFRSTHDSNEAAERELVSRGDAAAAAAAAGAAGPQQQAGPGPRGGGDDPLAWLRGERAQAALEEGRRRECLQLGLPDDGYDYTQHLRRPRDDAGAGPGAAAVSLRAPVLVAPPEDARRFDARRLAVRAEADEAQVDAALEGGHVTAFARELDEGHRWNQAELGELEELVRRLEAASDAGDAGGQGDLLDDFVVGAAEVGTPAASATAQEPRKGMNGRSGSHAEDGAASDSDESDSDRVSWETEEEEGGEEGDGAGAAAAAAAASPSLEGSGAAQAERRRRGPGSIASSYWRPERHDRAGQLSVIDERFEAVALEYESDDIGELDSEPEGDDAPRGADLSAFAGLLEECLAQQRESHAEAAAAAAAAAGRGAEGEAGQDHEAAPGPLSEAEVLRARTKEYGRQFEEEEAQGHRGLSSRRRGATAFSDVAEPPREDWDCESVLSLRSNLDNHPALLGEAPRRPWTRSEGSQGRGPVFRLSAKTGAPVPRREVASGAAAVRGQQSHSSAGGEEDEGSEGEEEEARGERALAGRRRGESAEEKRERKARVKEEQRQARVEKKERKQLFKEEGLKARARGAAQGPRTAVFQLP